MNTSPTTPIDVDTLMARIRAEVARRKRLVQAQEISAAGLHASALASVPIALNPLPLPRLPKPQFAQAERFHLNDFLALHDQDFIDAAYRGVLKRKADAAGRDHFLGTLRNGSLSKIEILGRLRYSPEGRGKKVSVRGLLPAFAVQHTYRMPVIGGLVAFAMALVRLPRIVRNLQGLEGYQHQRNTELESAIRDLARTADDNERQLGRGIGLQSSETNALAQRLTTTSDELGRHIESFSEDAQTQIATLVSALDSTAQTISSVDAALNTQRFAFEGWRDRSTQLESETVARVAATEQRIAESESRGNALDSRIAAAEIHNATLDGRIAASEARNAVLDSRITASESRGEIFDSRIIQFESHKQDIDRQLVDVIGISQQTSAQLASTLRDTLGALEQRVENLSQTLKSEQDNSQVAHLRLIERVARAEGRLHEQSLRAVDASAVIDTASIKKGKAPVEKPSDPAQASSRFDKLYFAFEQRFRGTREDIRQRLSYYLPMLHESVVGKEGAMLLDVGCGRGEWLELLRDERLTARGIDINATMADECVARGLDVATGDAIALLKQLPDNALGALTGFHIIEHIPLETLLELIEQAHRVVQPGGLVIFETPNPENVVVGSCNFYIDPTHQRPLPPIMTQFLVEAGGFVDVRIHRVNANLLPQVFEEPREDDPPALRTALNFLRSVFLCAPDYSIVGRVA